MTAEKIYGYCWLHDDAGGDIVSYRTITKQSDLEAAEPIKYIHTLTVNGKEWDLPEPLTDDAPRDFYYISEVNTIKMGFAKSKYHNEIRTQIEQNGGSVYDTEADAQAWADFDKWCRGGEE